MKMRWHVRPSCLYLPLIENIPKALSASTVRGETPGFVWGPYRFKFKSYELVFASVISVGDSELIERGSGGTGGD